MQICLYIVVAVMLSSAESIPVRTRHWSRFNASVFGINARTEPQPRHVVEASHKVTRKAVINPSCLVQLPNTLMFQGFLQPVFTFDSNIMNCLIVYGVTVRTGAPNVFRSLRDCKQTCCSGKWC
ncbi:hypothetical protein QR680_015964 [Steinernema hermaphroditum]|uniref:BPTI/Kunitz inhibitor domain-containing protein n=1 Tax=Steinernema hermaphroditum TaxID=289476 RepID=A0AA39LLI2_9BILA|nr:hypothetical protein QR680_015964 [Steinernema hermaphroditum]